MNIYVKSKFSDLSHQPVHLGTNFNKENAVGIILTRQSIKGEPLSMSIESVRFYLDEKTSSPIQKGNKKGRYASDSNASTTIKDIKEPSTRAFICSEERTFDCSFLHKNLKSIHGVVVSKFQTEESSAFLLKYDEQQDNQTPIYATFRVVMTKPSNTSSSSERVQVASYRDYGVRLYENQSILIGSVYGIQRDVPDARKSFTTILHLLNWMIYSSQYGVRKDHNIFQLDGQSVMWIIRLALEFACELRQTRNQKPSILYRDEMLEVVANFYSPSIQNALAQGQGQGQRQRTDYVWIYELSPWIGLVAIGHIVSLLPSDPTALSSLTLTQDLKRLDALWMLPKGLVVLNKLAHHNQVLDEQLPHINLRFFKQLHSHLKKCSVCL